MRFGDAGVADRVLFSLRFSMHSPFFTYDAGGTVRSRLSRLHEHMMIVSYSHMMFVA